VVVLDPCSVNDRAAQGPVGPNPDLSGATSFAQSEYLVYTEAQCRIR